MGFGFIQMGQKTLFQLPVGGLVGHFRQGLHKLLLGIIDVLQLMHEQVVHGLDVFGEESHRKGPFFRKQDSAGFLAPHAAMFGC